MKKFYLHDGANQSGPFDLDELRRIGINNESPIWYEGLSNWTTAGQLEELNNLFNVVTPPPFGGIQAPILNEHLLLQPATTPIVTKKKRVAKKIVIITVVIIIAIGGLAFYDLMNPPFRKSPGLGESYEEKVMSVEEIERSRPTDFLSATETYHTNFWGNKFKITCIINNKATVATYKDAIVRITYYSKTHTELGSKDITIYELLLPTSSKTVELKVDNYKDVASIGCNIISAIAN